MTTVEPVTSTTAEWLLEISGLTVGATDGDDVVVRGHALADQVRAAAAAYRTVTSCTLDACSGACPLAAFDGGPAACQLAARLAPTPAGNRRLSTQRATRLYVQALRAAATAVFGCKRHAHPVGECWFAGLRGEQLCNDVLAVTHRMGG